MKILNHKLEGIDFKAARWIGPAITPEIVVLHDTASHLIEGNAAAYLRDNDAKVSVHFVIERSGAIVQLVPTNHRANHAGQSSFQGRSGCNDFSIGIEIVNPGRMTLVSRDPLTARAWFKTTFVGGEVFDLAELATPEHGSGVWMDYTAAQITAVTLLLECLFRDIPSLRDITTHWEISPGRKVDTNPLFPLQAIRAKVLGRDDPAEAAAEAASDVVGGDEFVQIETPGTTLNLRRWPSFNPNILAAIPDHAIVPVNREGLFGGRRWLNVTFGGLTGWIVATYAAPVRFGTGGHSPRNA